MANMSPGMLNSDLTQNAVIHVTDWLSVGPCLSARCFPTNLVCACTAEQRHREVEELAKDHTARYRSKSEPSVGVPHLLWVPRRVCSDVHTLPEKEPFS